MVGGIHKYVALFKMGSVKTDPPSRGWSYLPFYPKRRTPPGQHSFQRENFRKNVLEQDFSLNKYVVDSPCPASPCPVKRLLVYYKTLKAHIRAGRVESLDLVQHDIPHAEWPNLSLKRTFFGELGSTEGGQGG